MKQETALSRLRVARTPRAVLALDDASAWDEIPSLPPLVLADGSAPATQATRVRVCLDDDALFVRFDCADRDIWGTYTRRDEPIYEEEVVEVFLAPGAEDPRHYFEFQVSPTAVLFDSTVHAPTGRREDMRWDVGWNCPEIKWAAERDDINGQWWAALAIPWRGITENGPIPTVCRANFYRIERQRDGDPEYSCWSPTFTNPADFHKPAYFGILEMETRTTE